MTRIHADSVIASLIARDRQRYAKTPQRPLKQKVVFGAARDTMRLVTVVNVLGTIIVSLIQF